MKIAMVVVFLDEEQYLPTLLDSVAAQSRPPDRLILVDDGSTDGSAEWAERFAERHHWVDVQRRPTRGPERDRLASASVWTGFQSAVEHLDAEDYDVVAKVDADLALTPRLLEEIEARFSADPTLGLTGPYLSELDAVGRRKRLRWRPEHVGGATKFYRRECYDDVYPLPALLNLDMVDEVKARARGWRTQSFEASAGDPVHLRPHGTRDGTLRGFRRWGRGDYVSGSHPLLVLFVGLQRLREQPPVIGSLNYFAGYALAALRRSPRWDVELRVRHRHEQIARVRQRGGEAFSRGRARLRPSSPGARIEAPSAGSQEPAPR